MAEATGLALGGIALASLITTCVEFLQYFEDGRDCMRDFTMAVTKMKLMKARLGQLGQLGELGQLGDTEDMSIQPCQPDRVADEWHHVASALPEGLSAIHDIIQRTTELCRRYNHGGGADDGDFSFAAQPLAQQRTESSGETPPAGRRAILRSIKRKTSWALHDKKKLDVLIADFEFLLRNLEKIIESSAAKTKPKPCQETPFVMDERDSTPKKMDEKSNTAKKRDEKPSTSSRPDAHAGEKAASPPGLGRTRAPAAAAAPAPVLETVFVQNAARNQAVFAMGGQRDGDPTNMRFQENVIHDQSLAFAGNYALPLMQEVVRAWESVAKGAVALKQQSQAKATPVRRLRSETNDGEPFVKLTGETGAGGCRA